MSKMGRHILAKQEEELNRQGMNINEIRQVKGVDSKNNNPIEIEHNKFKLCHLGETVMKLYKKYPNDADLGKRIRELILSQYE